MLSLPEVIAALVSASKICFMQQRTKYRIGVMKVREQRRQGILNSEAVKSLGSSRASSISSVPDFESSLLSFGS